MRETIGKLLSVVLLAGCAATPGSQSMMITGDTALISVPSRSRESKAELLDRGMREAAAITRAHGFAHFAILDAAETAEVRQRRRPGQTLPNQNEPLRGGGFATTNLSATYLPGATYTTPDQLSLETRVTLDLTIRMYRAGEIDSMASGACDIVASREGARDNAEYICNALK
jgi:hypothetical protein